MRIWFQRRRCWVLGALAIGVAVTMFCTMPLLRKAELAALVSACPVAYVAEDGKIHLTNESATVDIELPAPPANGRIYFIGSPPSWSPDGRLIAYSRFAGPGGNESKIVVVEPVTGRFWELVSSAEQGLFGGWAGDGTLHEVHVGFRNPWTGAIVQTLEIDRSGWHLLDREALRKEVLRASTRGMASGVRQVSPRPARLGGGVIAIGPAGSIRNPYDGIHLRDGNFDDLQAIWRRERVPPSWVARLAPSGNWAGWTALRLDEGPRRWMAVKSLSAPEEGEPQWLGERFDSTVFCDWIDDVLILANVEARNQWSLVILNREGDLVRRIRTDAAVMPEGGASWRHVYIEDGR